MVSGNCRLNINFEYIYKHHFIEKFYSDTNNVYVSCFDFCD